MAVSDVGTTLIGSAWGLASALGVVDVAHSMGKALPFWARPFPIWTNIFPFVLFTVFLPLLLYGLALAYYLPAIPFIRWISALVGWIILVVEALVAARSGSVPMPCPKGTALRDSTANGATSCCSASLFVLRLWSADSSPPSSS